MADFNNPALETATFGMGWFWGPDARFGHLKGVVSTRVGYAGGTTEEPTYRKMGDHSETLQIDFDPNVIAYDEILEHFWNNHNPRRHGYGGRQYMSILLYASGKQKEQALIKKEELEKSEGMAIETEISPLRDFWLAEDYHQKYYLKRWPPAADAVMSLYEEHEDFVNSTLAARLNGFVKGFGSVAAIKEEVQEWELPEEEKARLTNTIRSIKW